MLLIFSGIWTCDSPVSDFVLVGFRGVTLLVWRYCGQAWVSKSHMLFLLSCLRFKMWILSCCSSLLLLFFLDQKFCNCKLKINPSLGCCSHGVYQTSEPLIMHQQLLKIEPIGENQWATESVSKSVRHLPKLTNTKDTHHKYERWHGSCRCRFWRHRKFWKSLTGRALA